MGLSSTEQQLRSFLLGVAAFIFIGTVAELYLLEHFEETKQWIPVILSIVGFSVSIAALWKPGRKLYLMLRWVMCFIALGSLYGMYLHFMGNFEFTLEINPSFSTAKAIWPAVKGSYPLLAPGILFLPAILAAAATYRHPVMEKQEHNFFQRSQ